jgi:hypothetical protein
MMINNRVGCTIFLALQRYNAREILFQRNLAISQYYSSPSVGQIVTQILMVPT